MKNERLGLVIVAASLIAIVIVGGVLYLQRIKFHEEKNRVHGIALTHALSSAEYSQLVPSPDKGSLMRRLIDIQGNEDFAYGAVVNLTGRKLYEVTTTGSVVPTVSMPNKPYEWSGEHDVASSSNGRHINHIREFFAPIVKNGQLAGFVRAGYYSNPTHPLTEHISSFGLMALPIFLLTIISYSLIRREIRPLNLLSNKMEKTTFPYGVQASTAPHGQDFGAITQYFDNFIQQIQSSVQQMDKESTTTHTNAHLLSYKQEKVESALNSVPDAVLVIDNACMATFSNPKVEPILGIKRDAIIGKQPQEWCNDKDILAFLMRFRSIPMPKYSANIEYFPDGNPDYRISISAFPLFSPRDHNIFFDMLIIFLDISKEYLARQASHKFVSHVPHELKTPLNSQAIYSELLLGYAVLTEKDRIDAVNVIHSEVERMTSLINNLLNISKMESGTLQLSCKRVKLQDTFDSMRNSALGKGTHFELSISYDIGAVRLDKDMYRIAIGNLLCNAIKYSNDEGKVILSAKKFENDQIQVGVRDQGVGISAEDCTKVFTKYYRASNAETVSRSSHGFGLYLAKQIIEPHQGNISVTSEQGKCTEFIIQFKARPVQLEESNIL